MSLEYKSRMQAIEELTGKFYQCKYDGRIQEPWYSREFEDRTEYGFLCGHVFPQLPRRIDVETAAHPAYSHLTAETDGYRYTSNGRSFLTQYYQILSALELGTANNLSVKDQSNTSQSVPPSSISLGQMCKVNDAAADTNYGILAGTGTTANSGTTVALATLIAQGNGAGQLSYGSTAQTQPSGTAPLSYTYTRTLTNNSGGNITINEAGLAGLTGQGVNTAAYFMWVRDVNAGGLLTINNTNNSTLTYTLSYTIS